MEEIDSELAATLTKVEQAQRRRFVTEYLKDHDELGAAIRIGFAKGYAAEYAAKFMEEPFVCQLIANAIEKMGGEDSPEFHRKKILAGLYRESANRFNSGAARVAAYAQISKITGNDAPIKIEQKVTSMNPPPDLSHLSIAELEEIKLRLRPPDATSE